MSTKKQSGLPTEIEYASIPQFRVNLDEPAETRWNHVITPYIDEFEKTWKIITQFLFDLIPYPLLYLVKYICSILLYLRLFPHSNELIGIAKCLNKSPGELALMHISYEVTSFCTSILINDKSIFGSTINLRTMDWSMPIDLRNLTAKIHFINNKNEVLYTSIMFVGAVGVVTGIKSNKFSIAVNFRNSAYNNVDKNSWITCKTIMGFVYNFSMIFIGGWTVTSLIRYICENAKDYDEAVFMAKNKWLISPTFITITGNKLNQGIVLTRDRLKCIDENVCDVDKNEYVVQCNSDHWTIDDLNKYSDIYESKERHDMAEEMLPKLLGKEDGQKMKKKRNGMSGGGLNIVDEQYKNNRSFTAKQLEFISKCWRFLSVYPIRNEETVYSCIIIPKNGLILTGKTTTEFEAVSAQEFKDMFYMSSSSLDQMKKE